MRTSSNRSGAALLLAVLWITIIGVAAAASITRLSAERRSQTNRIAEVDAYALAQAGLERYLATATSAPNGTYTTTVDDLPGGVVEITVHQLREGSDSVLALYAIRSRANTTGAERLDPTTGDAVRSVARFAAWEPGWMNVYAAWTSTTGIHKNGASGTISGFDQCGRMPAVAGVAVPVTAVGGGAGYHQNGARPVPTGEPPIAYLGATVTEAAQAVDIDWAAIVGEGALSADYTLTSTSGWPSDFSSWPVIYIDNPTTTVSLGPGQSGRGLLAIRGNATFNGSFSWQGVILVGGVMGGNGIQTIHGAVVSGLNAKLGEYVARNSIGNGNKNIQYNSCYVRSALARFGRFGAAENAWTDNWPEW